MGINVKGFVITGLVACMLVLPMSRMVCAEESTDSGCPWKIRQPFILF